MSYFENLTNFSKVFLINDNFARFDRIKNEANSDTIL